MDYFKLKKALYLDGYAISFRQYPKIRPIKPFECWDEKNPTKSLFWYDAYNKVKHDRETNMECASFESVVNSLSALIIMLYTQFGPDHNFWKEGEFLNIIISVPEHELKDYYIPAGNPQKAIPFAWKSDNYMF